MHCPCLTLLSFMPPCLSHLGVSLISGHKASYFLDIPQPGRHMSNTDPLLLLQFLTHNTRVPKSRTRPFLHSSLFPLQYPLNPGPNCPPTSHTCLCLTSGLTTFHEDFPLFHKTQSSCGKDDIVLSLTPSLIR